MDYSKFIELYVGRKIDFLNEVILQDDGQGVYIRDWNIPDKPKPDLAQLQIDYADAYRQQIQKEQLKAKIKKARGLIISSYAMDIDNTKYVLLLKSAIRKYKTGLEEL